MDAPLRRRGLRFGLRTLLLLVLIAAVATAVYRNSQPRDDLTAKMADLIEPGMTKRHVRWQLGVPWSAEIGHAPHHWFYRTKDGGLIVVHFDASPPGNEMDPEGDSMSRQALYAESIPHGSRFPVRTYRELRAELQRRIDAKEKQAAE